MKNARCFLPALAASALLLFTFACGGGSSSSQNSSGTGTSTTANTVPVSVNVGPSGVYAYTNGVFVSVEVCKPGTGTCVTVPNVLLDTGSTGLRLLSDTVSSLGLSNTTSGGQTIANCVQYLDNTYNWGPVATADIKMAGETASAVPIQIIAEPDYTFPAAPASCGGTPNDTLDTLLANGILGVNFVLQDCGTYCAPGTTSNPGNYYSCTSSSCTVTTVPVAQQLQNPVALFATDNNGVILALDAVPAAGAVTGSGTLTFGIGTQSNNTLGSATVLTTDDYGNIATKFGNTTTDVGFIDSGSTALFFLTSALTGLPECADDNSFYCPASTESLSATNSGSNGANSTVNFSVANADNLLNSTNDAFSNLAGPGTDPSIGTYFDWGLPFFYGRSVYVAFVGANAGGTTGPYWAY
jgi:hypothetical protein